MQCGELSEEKFCATGCCTKLHIKQRGSDGVTRQELFTWIRQQYGTEPEYPWHDWNAVLRHNDNNKWYGVVLEVSADKLGLPEAGIVDVLSLFLLCCFFIIVFVETILVDFIFYKPPE